jgi:predicted pyridoxine 5'-phosphate oxidase superfamily flavin-nucleotide-binding protein
MASLGNIRENPRIGILVIDFTRDRIGLHVNGRARLVADGEMRERHADLPADTARGRRPVVWVEAEVEEAYIHCAKHIPRLVKAPLRRRAWGTDDVRRKGGDHVGVKAARQTARRWFGGPASRDARPSVRDVRAPAAQPVMPAASRTTAARPVARPSRRSAPVPARAAAPS